MRTLWGIPGMMLVCAAVQAQTSSVPIEPPAGKTAGESAATVQAGANATNEAATEETRALLTRGRTLMSAEKWQEAAAVFQRALTLEPDNDDALFGLGTIYVSLERFGDAMPIFEKLLKRNPGNPFVRNNLAWIYLKTKDPALRSPEKALRLARDAVLDVPSDANVWNTLAEAYYVSGDYQRALRVARQYLQMLRMAGETDQTAAKELLTRCRTAAGATAEPEE